MKTGDPATWHPSASSNLDADLDQDFLRSDDADLAWDTLTASFFLIEGWRCIMEGLLSQTWQMARKVAGEREAKRPGHNLDKTHGVVSACARRGTRGQASAST